MNIDLTGTANDLSVTFSYNPASQIAQTVRTGDAYAFTGHSNGTTAYAQNGLNQQITIGGSSASWDSRGNLTTDPTTAKTYGYDSENKLASASGGVSVYYDPLGRLAEYDTNVSTRFMSDGAQVAVEIDNPAGNILKRYVWGDGADELIAQYDGSGTANRRFAGADERGSIVSLTDSSGTLVGINRYDEYGRPGASNVGRFQYTGQGWFGETGAYSYKARNYLPHLGVFAQADPIGYADSANLYAYVLNDPVNLVDPFGLCGYNEVAVQVPGDDGDPSVITGHFLCLPAPSFGSGGTSILDSFGLRVGGGGVLLPPGVPLPPPPPPPPQQQQPSSTCSVSESDSQTTGATAGSAVILPEYVSLAFRLGRGTALRSIITTAGREAAVGAFAVLGGRVTVAAIAVGAGVYAYDRYSDGKVTRLVNRQLANLNLRIGEGCQ